MEASLGSKGTHRVWAISWVDSRTIEEKSNRGRCFSLTLAEGVHELREGGGALDLEEDFVVVICDLDIQVLALRLIVRIATGTRRLITVRHGERWSCRVVFGD